MSSHSIAEAKERFPELIDRALQGEPVVITRDGAPVLELRAVAPGEVGRITDEAIDWLERNLVRQDRLPVTDAATLIRQMRDED